MSQLVYLGKENREAISILLNRKAAYLTEWEIDFLHGLKFRSSGTPAQMKKLDEIWADVMEHNREEVA